MILRAVPAVAAESTVMLAVTWVAVTAGFGRMAVTAGGAAFAVAFAATLAWAL